MGLRKALLRLRPQRIEMVLFELRGDIQETGIAPPELTFHKFTLEESSGRPEIDARLSADRSCYAFLAAGEVAHTSWLIRDVLLPATFGFAADVPVIGDCDTPVAFRGRRLYPIALQRIARDVAACAIADRVHILVAPDNHASIRGIEHAGGVRRARLGGLRIAGLTLRKQRGD